jgi:Tfp pilus assembly protein PilX
MRRWRLVQEESGIALVLALGILVVLAIVVTAGVTYTTSNTRASGKSTARIQARQYAETALNQGMSILTQQIATNGNPTAANILGCAGASGVTTDATAPSNCSSPSPKRICFVKGSTCTAGAADTAELYGYFSGTNAQTFLGRTIPAATWLLVGKGYSYDPSLSAVTSRTAFATVKISSVTNGAVAAMWNHIFLTAPLVPNVCQTDFAGNNLVIDVPLYVVGNLCLSGNNNFIKEVGQPIDLEVGGKLVLSGPNTQVGTSSTVPITSGVVVGGCTTVSVASSTTACNATNFRYYVGTTDTFNSQAAPVETGTDIQSDYATFDPGPMHACKAGTSPAGLASTAFDTDTTYNSSAATFELTPAFSYDCQSTSGTSVGRLKWDNTAKTLTIAGSIFVDGNMTISQSATYTGTAVIEASGSITISGNSTTLCATYPCNTALNAWQGSSGNNSMLTLAALKSTGTSFTMNDNTQIFQGSLWTQPATTVAVLGNSCVIEGPISIGTMSNQNNVDLKPLPIIKNMPVGAPLPPNTGVTLGPLISTS